MAEHTPTYQMTGTEISAMTPFAKMGDGEPQFFREDQLFRFDMHLMNKDYNMPMNHTLLMSREVFHAFVNRLVFVAQDQGMEITNYTEET